ncbi:hypothetical protein [Anoxybacteroides tepidamans]|uniref:hypothetical protein n=1 Tax=Anoxybacteroides tepidamans TaxID=265948 RepID=UPI0012EB7D72|nr:hypothetical protein [Anoxybacillus tepidamans]
MQMAPTAKKPMADKVFVTPVVRLSIDLCEELLSKLERSTVSDDVKFAISEWVLTFNEHSFSHLIKTCSKKRESIEKGRMEELIALQNKRVQEIFNSESVKLVGRGLNRLIRDKKGYEIQVALLNCYNVRTLTRIIRDINLLYYKNYNQYRLEEKHIAEIIGFSETDKDVQIIGDAILTYSTVFFERKEQKE